MKTTKLLKVLFFSLLAIIVLIYSFMIYAEINNIWLGPISAYMTNDGLVYGMTGGVKLLFQGNFINGFDIFFSNATRGIIGKLNLGFLILLIIIGIYILIKNKRSK